MAEAAKITLQDGTVEIESGRGIVILPITKFVKYVESFGVVTSTPVLPPNCIYYSSHGAYRMVVLERPEQLTDIIYGYDNRHQETYKNVPIPNLLMILLLQYNQSRRDFGTVASRLFATPDRITSLDASVYDYPFGNTDAGNGNICWGSNPIPAIKEISACGLILDLFMLSPTNNDLSFNKYNPYEIGDVFTDSDLDSDEYGCERLLDYIAEHPMDTFPADAMHGCGRNLSHWMQYMKDHFLNGWT